MDAQNSLLRQMLSAGSVPRDGNAGVPICNQSNNVILSLIDQRPRPLVTSPQGDRPRVVIGQSGTQQQHLSTPPLSQPLWSAVSAPANRHFAPAGFTFTGSPAVNATPSISAVPVMSMPQPIRTYGSTLSTHSCGPTASLSMGGSQLPLHNPVISMSRSSGAGSISATGNHGHVVNNAGTRNAATVLAPFTDRAAVAVREISPEVSGPTDDLLPSLGWIDIDMALDTSLRPGAGDQVAVGDPFCSLDAADAADTSSSASGSGSSFMDLRMSDVKMTGAQPAFNFGIQHDAVDGNLLDYAGDGSQFLRGTENILAAYPVNDDFIDLDFELPPAFSVADIMLASVVVASSPPTSAPEPTTVTVMGGSRVTPPRPAGLGDSSYLQTKSAAAGCNSGGFCSSGLGSALVWQAVDAEGTPTAAGNRTFGSSAKCDSPSAMSSNRPTAPVSSDRDVYVAGSLQSSSHRMVGTVVPETPTVHVIGVPRAANVSVTEESATSPNPKLPTAASYHSIIQLDRSPSPAANGLNPASRNSSSPMDIVARAPTVAPALGMTGASQLSSAVDRLEAPTANAVRQQRMLATEEILRRSGLLDATMLTGRVTARQRVIQFEIQKLKQAMQEFVMSIVCEEPEAKRRRFH